MPVTWRAYQQHAFGGFGAEMAVESLRLAQKGDTSLQFPPWGLVDWPAHILEAHAGGGPLLNQRGWTATKPIALFATWEERGSQVGAKQHNPSQDVDSPDCGAAWSRYR